MYGTTGVQSKNIQNIFNMNQLSDFFMQYNLGDHKKVPKPYTNETGYLQQAISTRNDEKVTQPYYKFVENLCIANHDIRKFLSRTLLMFRSIQTKKQLISSTTFYQRDSEGVKIIIWKERDTSIIRRRKTRRQGMIERNKTKTKIQKEETGKQENASERNRTRLTRFCACKCTGHASPS